VTDKTGATVEDARVTVINEASGISKAATPRALGPMCFPDLLVGNYTVTVEKAGFRKAVSKGIQWSRNQVAEASSVLEIGDVSSVVEVEAGRNW